MTREEVEAALKSLGFEIRRRDPSVAYATIWLNDEQLGELNVSGMNIARYIPSSIGLIASHWLTAGWETLNYSKIDGVNELKQLKLDLLNSRSRWEQSIRQERVEKVKQYFNEQKSKVREIEMAIKVFQDEYDRREQEATCA